MTEEQFIIFLKVFAYFDLALIILCFVFYVIGFILSSRD